MTLTLELSPETEARLRAIALEKGASLEAVALKRLDVSLLSEEDDQIQTVTSTAPLSRYAKNVFEAVAKERGISFEEVVALYPEPTEELLEDLEDEVDGAEAERRMANSDPSQWKTLDDLRKVLGR